jgi:hypothetical protein
VFFVAGFYNLGYVNISFVRNNTFGIIVKLAFGGFNIFFNMIKFARTLSVLGC